jgi:hypothetical protein
VSLSRASGIGADVREVVVRLGCSLCFPSVSLHVRNVRGRCPPPARAMTFMRLCKSQNRVRKRCAETAGDHIGPAGMATCCLTVLVSPSSAPARPKIKFLLQVPA